MYRVTIILGNVQTVTQRVVLGRMLISIIVDIAIALHVMLEMRLQTIIQANARTATTPIAGGEHLSIMLVSPIAYLATKRIDQENMLVGSALNVIVQIDGKMEMMIEPGL
jgi:hypothetical protein